MNQPQKFGLMPRTLYLRLEQCQWIFGRERVPAEFSGARSDLSADRLGSDDFVDGPHFLDELVVLIDG